MNLTPEALRTAFHDLCDQRDAIRAVSTPMREARDAFVQDARAQEDAMNAAIREAEAGLFDIEMQIGAAARALGGKTGERPAPE